MFDHSDECFLNRSLMCTGKIGVVQIIIRRISSPIGKEHVVLWSYSMPKEDFSSCNSVSCLYYKVVMIEPWTTKDEQFSVLLAVLSAAVLLVGIVRIDTVLTVPFKCGFYECLVFLFSAVEGLDFTKTALPLTTWNGMPLALYVSYRFLEKRSIMMMSSFILLVT